MSDVDARDEPKRLSRREDPDRLLREMRAALTAAEDGATEEEREYQSAEAAVCAGLLDQHISGGGALPRPWQPHATGGAR